MGFKKKRRMSQILSKTHIKINVFFFDPGPYFILLKKRKLLGAQRAPKLQKGASRRRIEQPQLQP